MLGALLAPHLAGLPTVPSVLCAGGVLAPVCGVGGAAASGIASAGAGAVLGAVAGWVVGGATWLLGQIGDVLAATTTIDVGARWFTAHFDLMAGLAGVVVLPMLLVSVIQAVARQSAALLLRAFFVSLPLAALLTFAALQLVQMGLKVTDDLSAYVAAGSGTDLHHVLDGTITALTALSGAEGFPAFVLLLGALVVALGAFALWVELLLRAAAVYVAVLFLPLALASLVWPAVSHWCRRLVETLAALILSKFVIVTILCLALGALGSGSTGGAGFASVLAGAALLLLAAFSPFVLLRLVPLAESSALEHLATVRQRAQHALVSAPRTAASGLALAQQLGAGSLEGALAAAGPVGSGLSGGSGPAGAPGGVRVDDPGPAPPGADHVPPWRGEAVEPPPTGTDGSTGASFERAGAPGPYRGPRPVLPPPAPPGEAPAAGGGVAGTETGGRATVADDGMGPTMRFVELWSGAPPEGPAPPGPPGPGG